MAQGGVDVYTSIRHLKSEDRYYAGRAGVSRMLEVGHTESSRFNGSRVEILAEVKRKICERKEANLVSRYCASRPALIL